MITVKDIPNGLMMTQVYESLDITENAAVERLANSNIRVTTYAFETSTGKEQTALRTWYIDEQEYNYIIREWNQYKVA